MNHCRRHPSTTSSTLLLICLLGSSVASPATMIVEGMGGIQQTKFAWNIAGMGGTPNVLSELTFKSTAPKGTLGLRWLNQSESFFIDTTIAYAQMTEGNVRDDDEIELFSGQPDFPTVYQDFMSRYIHTERPIDISRPFGTRPIQIFHRAHYGFGASLVSS